MEPTHFDVPWGSIIQMILAASFGAWAFLLKTMGNQHIATIKDLANEMHEIRRELNEIRKELANVHSRIGVLEFATRVERD